MFLNQDHLARQNSLHCVNLAQGFKEPVIYYQQSHNPQNLEAVKEAIRKMRHTIGFPTGLWAGDELLRFGNPTQGSELCTAVEMMFSLEKMLEITGDVQWADHLEKVAYNVLPTQIKDDFSARQYYQQVNQVAITCEGRNFVSPHEDTDIVFGELSGYPCCTSNLHQGWPKFTRHLWFATADNGIASLIYAPSEVTAQVGNDITVKIAEKTDYPFEEKIDFNLSFPNKKDKKAFFPFHLRIPAWCNNPLITINGETVSIAAHSGEIVRINREWKDGDHIQLELPMRISTSNWYDDAVVIERGPLLYSLKMDEKWERKVDQRPESSHKGEWYYEVTSTSPWNYSLVRKYLKKEELEKNFVVKKVENIAPYPWNLENAPITIKTKGRILPSWKMFKGSAGPVNFFMQANEPMGDEETIELIPYGCMSELPVLFGQQRVAAAVVAAVERQRGTVHPVGIRHYIMVCDLIGFLGSLEALLVLAGEHTLSVADVEIVAAASVNAYRRKVERVAAVHQTGREQHGTVAVHVEVLETERHVHGHVPAVALHFQVADGNPVHDGLCGGLRLRHRTHAQKGDYHAIYLFHLTRGLEYIN